MNKRDKTRVAKVCLLGSVGVGKSSIVRRFTLDEFREDEITTVGAAFTDKTIQHQDNIYKFQIWDTAGQEKYAPLTHMYYRDAHVALLVFDITDSSTFERAKAWLKILKDEGSKGVLIVMVGNKNDMAERRKIDEDAVRVFAEENRALFAFTSAKDNTGITQMFYSICERLQEDNEKDYSKSNGTIEPIPQQNIQILSVTSNNTNSDTKKSNLKQGCC